MKRMSLNLTVLGIFAFGLCGSPADAEALVPPLKSAKSEQRGVVASNDSKRPDFRFVPGGMDSDPILTLEADRDCYAIGSTVSVTVWMHDIGQMVVGGQFFLGYDKTVLDFISAAPGDEPFTVEILNEVNETEGTIDYAVGLTQGSSGTANDTRMAVITFQALEQICSADDLVIFREHSPPSRLGDANNQPIYPGLVNLVVLDEIPPTATQGVIDACFTSSAEAEAAALAATTDLTDNCTEPATLTKEATSTTGCFATVTVTVSDPCGNSTDYFYETRIEAEPPTATTGSINSCYQLAADAEADAIAATTNLADNCSAPEDIELSATSIGDCDAIVTVTVTDECGNHTDYEYYTRIDGTPPTATQGVIDVCYDTIAEAEAAALAATTDLADNCADPAELTKDVSSTGECPAFVTVTVTDPCGNFVDYAYETRIDTEAPTATPGTIDACYATAAEAEAVAIAATTNPTDNCSAPEDIELTVATVGDCEAVVTVTVTDECGYYTEYAYNTRIDGMPPSATQGAIESCYSTAAQAEADALAATTDLTDNCTETAALSLSVATVGECDAVVTVTITDECGNEAYYDYETRIDSHGPVVTAPPDISVHADAGFCTAAIDPGQATVEDNCTADVVAMGTRSDSLGLNEPYPNGTTWITWEAADECGLTGSAVQTIYVDEFNELLVDVELKAVNAATLTRCITFEFTQCATSTTRTATQEVEFANGAATGVSVLVDCGEYDCLRARDGLHTLWRTDLDDFGVLGPHYVADFADHTGGGGADDALIGGNLFDDVPPYGPPQFIDIMDYAVFVNAWATNYGTGDTDCATTWPHADIDGDGEVGTADFTFIQTYFLLVDDPPCCGLAAGGLPPRTTVSIEELRRMGLNELIIADLNHDGWVDAGDVAAFAGGVRPQKPRPMEHIRGHRNPDAGGGSPATGENAEQP